MEKKNAPWKHNSHFLTFLCFISYHLGYYKYQIRAIGRFLFISSLTIALLYGIMYLFDLSVQIYRGGEFWFVLPG